MSSLKLETYEKTKTLASSVVVFLSYKTVHKLNCFSVLPMTTILELSGKSTVMHTFYSSKIKTFP